MSKWRGLTMRALCEEGISMSSKVLLAYLCERADKSRQCWPGRETVLEDTKMSRPSFFRARAELLAAGLLADRSDDKEGCLEVYPESQNETAESQNETAESQNETAESQNETAESQNETAESQNETAESQNETAYRCINSSRTPIEPPLNPPVKREAPVSKAVPAKPVLTMKFWARFTGRCTAEKWGLSEKIASSCAASLLVIPQPEHALLTSAALKALGMGHTEEDFMRLADFIAAGGVSWRGAAWQYVAKNFLAELSKASMWDPKTDPRQRSPTARAPTDRPQQLTTSKTTEVNEISGIEGLRRLGLDVPEGAVNRVAASEDHKRDDRAF